MPDMIQLTMAPNRVLVVARSLAGIAELIEPLQQVGCRIEWATSAVDALGRAVALKPEVIVIEDQLPDINVVELTMRIKAVMPLEAVPIFIMAMANDLAWAGSMSSNHESGFAQPQPPEVVARVTDILAHEQSRVTLDASRLNCHGLCLDRTKHRAWVDNHQLHLTPTEFKLLWELASHPGYVLSRAELSKLCKGPVQSVTTRTIDAHIKAIRRKLNGRAALIETVHGIGYRLQEVEW